MIAQTTSEPKKTSHKTMIIVALLVVVAIFVIMAGCLMLNEPKMQESAYVDIDAELKNPDEDVVKIGSAHFSDVPFELNDGWYYVIDSFTLTDDLIINGNVKIILKNNVVLDARIKVVPESELYIYSQSWDAETIGKLSSTSNTISLTDNSTLTNTAAISSLSGNCINGTGTVTITNGVTGTIHGHERGISFNGNGNIINHGDIMSKDTSGGHAIYSDAPAIDVTNEEFGLIRGPISIGVSNTTKVTLVNKSMIDGKVELDNIAGDVTFVVGEMSGNRSAILDDFALRGNESTLRFTGDLENPLARSLVTGSMDIGEGVTAVSIDVGKLTTKLKVGDIRTLVQSDVSIVGTPLNATFSDGGYSFEIFIDDNQLNIRVSNVPSS